MAGRPDADRLVRAEAEAGGDIALVVRQRDRARRVLVEQRLADLHPTERLLPGELHWRRGAVDLDAQAASSVQGSDRRRQVIGHAGEPDVAEAVDVDDPRLEPPVVDAGSRQAQLDEVLRRDARAHAREGRPVGEMRGDRAEDVAAVERG